MARPKCGKQTLLTEGVPMWEIACENFPDTFFLLEDMERQLEILSLGHQAQNCMLL